LKTEWRFCVLPNPKRTLAASFFSSWEELDVMLKPNHGLFQKMIHFKLLLNAKYY